MLFDLTKRFVPEVYSESRDYRVFLKLLGILISVLKDNIDSFPSLYSADTCPPDLLPYLADMVGYKYDEGISVDGNRIIIKYYPFMLRYRGSEEGIKLATALSLNTSDSASTSYSLDSIVIEFDYEEGIIKIYYPHTELIRKDLIEAVRPLGTRIQLIPSHISNNVDELDVKAKAIVETEEYKDSRHEVNKAKVGFGDVGTSGNEGS